MLDCPILRYTIKQEGNADIVSFAEVRRVTPALDAHLDLGRLCFLYQSPEVRIGFFPVVEAGEFWMKGYTGGGPSCSRTS